VKRWVERAGIKLPQEILEIEIVHNYPSSGTQATLVRMRIFTHLPELKSLD
jgi:hypothetical protein